MTMNATAFGAPRVATPIFADRAAAYIAAHAFDRPTLVVSRDRVAMQYEQLQSGLGRAAIHYAMRANPAPEVIETLVSMGAGFEVMSRRDIELCLSRGADPDTMCFGNTLKCASDIAFAYAAGIRLFAADCSDELHKIAVHAPGVRVLVQVLVENPMADMPPSRSFGCRPSDVPELMDIARDLGLVTYGLSFLGGSQIRDSADWYPVLDQIVPVWHAVREAGHDVQLLNIGGGFPAFYGKSIRSPRAYAADVMAAVEARFADVAQIMATPGRALVAEAGHIVAEVVTVCRKSENDLHRWVGLNIGHSSGLAETDGEAIRYPLVTDHDGTDTGPCVLSGPTSEASDVMYQKRPVKLPLGLARGDRVVIRNAGAYTVNTSWAGSDFIPPLDVIVI